MTGQSGVFLLRKASACSSSVTTAQAEDEPPLPQVRLAGGGIDEHEKIHRDGDGRAVAEAADAVSERGTGAERPSFTPAAAVCSR